MTGILQINGRHKTTNLGSSTNTSLETYKKYTPKHIFSACIFVSLCQKTKEKCKEARLNRCFFFFLRTKNKNNSKLSSVPYKEEKGKLKH